jgi:RNA polymerase sigma-70 factor (sigma-E family)
VSPGDQAEVTASGDASFEEFVADTAGRLFTMAMLLAGWHRAEAEDLLQDVLERAYRRWGRITRKGSPEPYVRQMLANAAVDRWRLTRRRREEPLTADTAGAAAGDRTEEAADRDVLLRALAELSPGQRTVLVLRFLEDLTEAQTAAVLGCSVGAVKSQASRALAKLREIIPQPVGRHGASADAASGGGPQKGAGNHG